MSAAPYPASTIPVPLTLSSPISTSPSATLTIVPFVVVRILENVLLPSLSALCCPLTSKPV